MTVDQIQQEVVEVAEGVKVTQPPSMRTVLEEYHKKGIFGFKPKSGFISDNGRKLIRRLVYKKHDLSINTNAFGWAWKTRENGAAYQGTLPKRIAKYVKLEYGVKLSSEIISEIGNIARANTLEDETYYIDFDQELDWRPGAFGDGYSCFWADRQSARDMLMDHGAFAVRFYDLPEDGKHYYSHQKFCGGKYIGYGRAWVVPDDPIWATMFLFNAYPENFRYTKVAHILAQLLDLSYRNIRLSNYGDSDSLLYVNSGAASIVGDADRIRGVDRIDLEWNEYDWGDEDEDEGW